MFDHPSFDQHERMVFAHDAAIGLRAIAAMPPGRGKTGVTLDVDGAKLHAAGILYAPDYVINAGGIISVGRDYLGGATLESVTAEILRIPVRLREIFARSSATHRPTSELEDETARQLLAEA
ncbi:MAG TPA: hypothetical protein VGE08_15615 [Steroidobacter sp.]|uniref:hypothetical protein n=1 Tax=Steroidobacter sp. TaxID=1978227 RepID=UPI002ED85732